MHITIKVLSLSPVHSEAYSIQHYVIKIVSDMRQVSGFLRVLRFAPLIKLTPRYNLIIVEGGVKHHKQSKPNLHYCFIFKEDCYSFFFCILDQCWYDLNNLEKCHIYSKCTNIFVSYLHDLCRVIIMFLLIYMNHPYCIIRSVIDFSQIGRK